MASLHSSQACFGQVLTMSWGLDASLPRIRNLRLREVAAIRLGCSQTLPKWLRVWVGTTVLPGVLAAHAVDLACPGGESWPGLARREWSGAGRLGI